MEKFGIKIAALWQALSLFTFIFGLHNESVIIKLLKVATGYEYAHLFCIGVAFVAIARNKKAVLPHIMLLVALFTHIAMYSISYTVFLLCIYAVLYLCIYGVIPDKLNYKGKKFVEFIAGISYPLYLLHQFIGYGILKWIESNVSTSEIIIFVPMAVSIA